MSTITACRVDPCASVVNVRAFVAAAVFIVAHVDVVTARVVEARAAVIKNKFRRHMGFSKGRP